WYVVYPGGPAGAESDIVFAVQVKKHRPGVQSAVVPRQPVPGGQPAPAQVPGQREAASPVAGGSSSVPSGQI
ncbi:MAG: hypothetical protein J2P33_24175, partial [Actinobacteria bacterium]|nr:hypothetical protein [Actinomycetota bacterium]